MDRSKKEDRKQCVICSKTFFRLDFLANFNRMVTCGNVACTGLRQHQRYKIRYEEYKLKNKGEKQGL